MQFNNDDLYCMKNVRVTMSDEVFMRLKTEAKKAGYPGISSYLLSKVDGLTTDAEAAEIVKKGRFRVTRKKLDKPFRLKDLFEKDEWDGFSKAARLASGRMFFEQVKEGGIDGVGVGEKNSTNHQTYIQIKD